LGEGNIFGHIAFEAAYRNGDEWLEQLLRHLESNINNLKQVCDMFPGKISFKEPEGTYLAWLDCRGLELSNQELSEFFIKEIKLGLGNGFLFGQSGSGFMRLNFAVSEGVMNEALQRINSVVRNA
jgi:cystathionine beta-lyase